MSWFSKINPVDIAEKNRRIDDLEREVQRYSEALQQEREKFENYKKSIEDAARSATFSFDFNVVEVFSVERNVGDGGKPVTIIGYLLPEPINIDGIVASRTAVKEWYLHCDDDQHKAIVKAFEDSRK